MPPGKILANGDEFSRLCGVVAEYSVGREDRMLDVHLPHGKLQGFKEFFLHLFTITIGLLIALGLEGWVEYEHHRHLAHEAEDGLRAEIAHNAQQIGYIHQKLIDEQKQLEADQTELAKWRVHPRKHGSMSLSFALQFMDDMSWKNAQNTGALALMPYKDAQNFSDIYLLQDEYLRDGRVYVSDMGNATSFLASRPNDWVPSLAQIDIETDRIGKVQFDLMLLISSVEELDKSYQKFESEHK